MPDPVQATPVGPVPTGVGMRFNHPRMGNLNDWFKQVWESKLSPDQQFQLLLAREAQASELAIAGLNRPNRTPGAGTRARVGAASSRFTGSGRGGGGSPPPTRGPSSDPVHIVGDPNQGSVFRDFGQDERDGVFGPLGRNNPPRLPNVFKGRAADMLQKFGKPGGF